MKKLSRQIIFAVETRLMNQTSLFEYICRDMLDFGYLKSANYLRVSGPKIPHFTEHNFADDFILQKYAELNLVKYFNTKKFLVRGKTKVKIFINALRTGSAK